MSIRTTAGDGTVSRILFGSCLDAGRPHPILETAAAIGHDLFVFLGDNVYADTEDPRVMEAKYRELDSSPAFKRLLRSSPVLAIWDDHDYGKNDAGANFPAKEESRRLFLDFWKTPIDSPRRLHEGVYDSAAFGPPERRVQVILLDERYFRTPLKRGRVPSAAYGPYLEQRDGRAAILGEAQWVWLEGELRKPAEVRLIASGVQVLAAYHGWESWANFPLELERLLDLLKKTGAEGVVFLSGDRHFAELSVLRQNDFYPLYDVTSSGLNVAFPGDAPNENPRRAGSAYLGENFGMVEVDWSGVPPRLAFRIFDRWGKVRIESEVPVGALAVGALR